MIAELEIVERLCRGIDPRTGESLNTPHDPRVDKARLSLLGALRTLNKQIGKNHGQAETQKEGKTKTVDPDYPNKGKPWNATASMALKKRWDQGETLDDLAKDFGRTAGAICARLAALDLSMDRETIRKINLQRGGVYGKEFSGAD